jgi:hypothetical protein
VEAVEVNPTVPEKAKGDTPSLGGLSDLHGLPNHNLGRNRSPPVVGYPSPQNHPPGISNPTPPPNAFIEANG